MRRASVLPGLLAIAAIQVGCGTGSAESHVVADSAGVRVVTSHAPAWGPGEAWRTGDTLLVIGAGSGGDALDLGGVAAAFPRPGGGYVIAEERGRVLFLDAAGRALGRAGGQGEGPGEFRLLAAAAAAGDSIWAYDYSLRRVTWLGPDGRLLRVTPLRTERAALLPVGRLGDGFVMAPSYDAGSGALEPGLRRDTVPYLRFDDGGAVVGTLERLPAREYVVGEEGGRTTMATPPFARSASHATTSDALIHGDRERWELRVVGPDGQTRAVYRRPGVELGIRDSDVAAEIERRIARHPASEQPGLRAFLEGLERPPTRPAHGPILVDADGFIWVAAYAPAGAAPESWDVLRPDGAWLGEVRLPERFRPTWIGGDRIVGVGLDDWDVERVLMIRLRRNADAGG